MIMSSVEKQSRLLALAQRASLLNRPVLRVKSLGRITPGSMGKIRGWPFSPDPRFFRSGAVGQRPVPGLRHRPVGAQPAFVTHSANQVQERGAVRERGWGRMGLDI